MASVSPMHKAKSENSCIRVFPFMPVACGLIDIVGNNSYQNHGQDAHSPTILLLPYVRTVSNYQNMSFGAKIESKIEFLTC